MTDVRRPEEPIRRSRDERLLGSRRRGQPGGPAIVVVTIRGRHELPLSDEPARLPVAQPLGRLGEPKTDRPKASVGIGLVVAPGPQIARIRLFLASWVSSALPRASSKGGMYIPNRPR
jgi:hypothetical protein